MQSSRPPGGLPDDIRPHETERITRALADPEFRRIFQQYAAEIADPAAKAEQEAYLRHLEEEGRAQEVYGRGAQLLAAQPALCIKARRAGGDAAGERVYINVCTCPKVAPPTLDGGADGGGPRGRCMRLPNCVNPKPLEVATSKGARAAAWDFLVHPAAVAQAAAHPGIMQLLAEVAMEQVAAAAGAALAPGHKLLKSAYRGPPGVTGPCVLMLRSGEADRAGNGVAQRRDQGRKPAGKDGDPAISQAPSAAMKRGFLAAAAGGHAPGKPGRQLVQRSSSESAGGGSGGAAAGAATPATPATRLVHRGSMDLIDAWSDAGRGLAISSLPKELVLYVELPGVVSVADMVLDVGADRVRLAIPGRYHAEQRLPYAVDPDASAARFDRRRQQLTVTMPLVQAGAQPRRHPVDSAPASSSDQPAAAPVDPGARTGGASSPAGGAAPQADDDAAALAACAPAQEAPQAAQGGAAAPPAAAPAVSGGSAHGKTHNQLRWEQLHAAQPAAGAGGGAAEGVQHAGVAAEAAALPVSGGTSPPHARPNGGSAVHASASSTCEGASAATALRTPLAVALQPRVLAGCSDELD